MVLVPEEVRCAVCKSIFCCLECRNRHEKSDHSPTDVRAERNRQKCGFCQGYPQMEFQSRNDFALIMHLCQTHLPLHCKKCLTQFNSIDDFSATNKCSHLNDVCSLQSPKQCTNNTIEHQSSTHTDVSNINYVTAVQKSSFERSISDSVISLRNYSTILHTSNHPLYKTQSPDAMENVLVRQTSTPMQHNLVTAKSPDSNGQSCSSCLVSSTSGQMSCINSDSSSDTSNNIAAAKPANEIRQNVQQQSIVVTQKKTTTFKRSRNSLTMTPLTRQVMTKSIHRALIEWNHSQHGGGSSPKSPLDLRMRTAVHRDAKNVSICTPPKLAKIIGKSPKLVNTKHTPSTSIIKSNSLEVNSKLSPLETVYEHEKDPNTDANECDDHENCVSTSYQHIEVSHDNEAIVSECDGVIGIAAEPPIGETPVLVSRKLSAEKITASDQFDGDIWFTPKEFVQSKVIENIEIYTPKVSKKRATVRRVDDEEHSRHTNTDSLSNDISKSEPNKTSGNKLWSFVSTFLRFASLTPQTDLLIDDLKENDDDESHVIIKRCSSFTGVLHEKNTSDEEDENDPLQPIKRRRITSIDTTMERAAMTYRKRIMCRPPIRRMLNQS